MAAAFQRRVHISVDDNITVNSSPSDLLSSQHNTQFPNFTIDRNTEYS